MEPWSNGAIIYGMNIHQLQFRSQVITLIRRFFDERGYTEVHTPRLVGLPGQEPHLDPFWTRLRQGSGGQASFDAALITSPEYAMKRLLAAGMDKIYDLGPCFRNNEPWDGSHDPEFLMLEWYRKEADLASLMDETEELIRFVGRRASGVVLPSFFFRRNDATTQRFRRMTVAEAWKQYLNVDLNLLLGDREAIAQLARSLDQSVSESDTWDDIYFKIFLSKIEPKVAEEPTFLYRYPVSMAALAKRSADDDRYADRVELYVNGLELANGFAELSDPVEQRKRFEEERALRASLGKETWDLDEKFLSDLLAMGDSVGIALGVDRLVMLLADTDSINDVIPFSARERFGQSDAA